jgi:SAM-dependent methyltransferase
MGYRNLRGVDGSAEQVAAARRLSIDGVEEGDVMETLVALPEGSLDCVIAFDLIEHFTKDELIALVDEVCRVLKPGGRWIIHTPNAESPLGNRMLFWDFTHELAFTRTSLAQLLLSSGFSAASCFEDQPVPHGLKSASRWLLWRFFRSLLRLYLAVETGDTGRHAIFSQNFLAMAIK